jgi:hypothetical protein
LRRRSHLADVQQSPPWRLVNQGIDLIRRLLGCIEQNQVAFWHAGIVAPNDTISGIVLMRLRPIHAA